MGRDGGSFYVYFYTFWLFGDGGDSSCEAGAFFGACAYEIIRGFVVEVGVWWGGSGCAVDRGAVQEDAGFLGG